MAYLGRQALFKSILTVLFHFNELLFSEPHINIYIFSIQTLRLFILFIFGQIYFLCYILIVFEM